jgi:hypothetical protein
MTAGSTQRNRRVLAIFTTRFREFALIGQKAVSKMETNACYREIFAEFVEGVQESEAQWYSIKPLHNEIPSLADPMEVSLENLQTLLVKGGLGKLGRDKELMSFQPSKFESFRSKFSMEDVCETTLQYVKGLKTKQWFVRLGTKYFGDLCVPGTKGGHLE